MSLIGRKEIILEEGIGGELDIQKLYSMMTSDEELIIAIPIEPNGIEDYDMVAGLTQKRVLIVDADKSHDFFKEYNISDVYLNLYGGGAISHYIEIGRDMYEAEHSELTKEFIEKFNEIRRSKI